VLRRGGGSRAADLANVNGAAYETGGRGRDCSATCVAAGAVLGGGRPAADCVATGSDVNWWSIQLCSPRGTETSVDGDRGFTLVGLVSVPRGGLSWMLRHLTSLPVAAQMQALS
jgi:hypothetical protein